MRHTVEELVLQNGARGLLVDVPDATVMSFDFDFRAGDRYVKNKKITETAHIMEHMVLGANKKFPNARRFNAELQKNGAYSNAYTGQSSLSYEASCADFEWDRILHLLELAITKPLFLESEFLAESGNVREELTGYLNNNNRVLWQRLSQETGEKYLTDEQRLAVMGNVNLADIVEHYERTHRAGNMRFIIAGNTRSRRQQIIDGLEKWKLGEGNRSAIIEDKPVLAKKALYVERPQVENVIFCFTSFANYRYDEMQRRAMSILNLMLTGTLHSLILGEARERGLVYGMWSDFSANKNTSEWNFAGQVSQANATPLMEIIIEQVKRVLKGDIADDDLEAAKQFALGKYQMSAQTVGSIANGYSGNYFFDGTINNYAAIPDKIRAVSKELMVQAANDMIKEKTWGFGTLGNCGQAKADELRKQLSVIWK